MPLFVDQGQADDLRANTAIAQAKDDWYTQTAPDRAVDQTRTDYYNTRAADDAIAQVRSDYYQQRAGVLGDVAVSPPTQSAGVTDAVPTPASESAAVSSPPVAGTPPADSGLPAPNDPVTTPLVAPGQGGKFSPYDDTFRKYAGDLANNDEFISMVAAGTKAESQWNTNSTTGDGGHSWGLFQMHDHGMGAGMGNARLDPDAASAVMVPRYADAYRRFKAQGLSGAQLAAAVGHAAEMNADASGSGYAQAWNDIMGGASNFVSNAASAVGSFMSGVGGAVNAAATDPNAGPAGIGINAAKQYVQGNWDANQHALDLLQKATAPPMMQDDQSKYALSPWDSPRLSPDEQKWMQDYYVQQAQVFAGGGPGEGRPLFGRGGVPGADVGRNPLPAATDPNNLESALQQSIVQQIRKLGWSDEQIAKSLRDQGVPDDTIQSLLSPQPATNPGLTQIADNMRKSGASDEQIQQVLSPGANQKPLGPGDALSSDDADPSSSFHGEWLRTVADGQHNYLIPSGLKGPYANQGDIGVPPSGTVQRYLLDNDVSTAQTPFSEAAPAPQATAAEGPVTPADTGQTAPPPQATGTTAPIAPSEIAPPPVSTNGAMPFAADGAPPPNPNVELPGMPAKPAPNQPYTGVVTPTSGFGPFMDPDPTEPLFPTAANPPAEPPKGWASAIVPTIQEAKRAVYTLSNVHVLNVAKNLAFSEGGPQSAIGLVGDYAKAAITGTKDAAFWEAPETTALAQRFTGSGGQMRGGPTDLGAPFGGQLLQRGLGAATSGFGAGKVAYDSTANDDQNRLTKVVAATLGGAIAGATVAPRLHDALWNEAIPKGQLQLFDTLTSGGMADDQASTVVNQIFGTPNLEKVFKTQTGANAARLLLQAPSWTTSQVQTIGNMVGFGGRQAAAQTAAWAAKGIGISMLMTEAAQLYFTGHTTLDNSPGSHFQLEIPTGEKAPSGKPANITFGFMPPQLQETLNGADAVVTSPDHGTAALDYVWNRINRVLTTGAEEALNVKYPNGPNITKPDEKRFGKEVLGDSGEQALQKRAAFAGEELSPISAVGSEREAQYGAPVPLIIASNLFGQPMGANTRPQRMPIRNAPLAPAPTPGAPAPTLVRSGAPTPGPRARTNLDVLRQRLRPTPGPE